MDIKQLYYFLTICEEGQITAAAKRLHMAQPPLSYQLKLLEEELGVALMLRGRHHLQLTDEGEILKDRAQMILQLCEQTKKEIGRASDHVHQQLTIGIVTSTHQVILQGLQTFKEHYPNINYVLKEGNTYQILNLIEKDMIDIGIIRTPFAHNQVTAYPLLSDTMVAAVANHIDPFTQDIISIRELQHQTLIYYERYAPLLESLFIENGFQPHVLCLNQDARTSLLWAKAALGVAIVPKSAISLIDCSGMNIHNIHEERLSTTITLVIKKNRYISSITHAFIAFYQQLYQADI